MIGLASRHRAPRALLLRLAKAAFHSGRTAQSHIGEFDVFARSARAPVNIERFTDRGFMVATTSAANAGATTAPPPGFAAGPSVFLRGPIILIDGQAVLWDVPTAVPDPADATAREKLDADMYGCLSAWTPEMLQLFVLAKNKPEIVVFGTGKSLLALPAALRNVFTSNGMQLEVSSTRNACSTFNVLVAEGRHVAACLLPNTPTSPFKSAPASATASVGSAVDHESASSD